MGKQILTFNTDKADQDISALGQSVNEIGENKEQMETLVTQMSGLWSGSNATQMLELVQNQVAQIQIKDFVQYACQVLTRANVNYTIAIKYDERLLQELEKLFS